MKPFVFENRTKVIFGENTISNIGKEILSRGYKRIVLVAGKESIKKNGVYNQLKLQGLDVTECWGVQANPTLKKVNEIIKIAKEKKAEAILAVGGGSVIDTAKAVAAGIFVDDVWQLFVDFKPIKKALPLFTVLTISATGSEMNGGAVITNEEEKKKWHIFGPALYPIVSVVDPKVQTSLPWNQTANGAVDALAHIMEFYFCGKGDEITLSIDETLMKEIIKATDILKKDEHDLAARSNLAWAATLALNGLSGSMLGGGDWSSHGIEHGISAYDNKVAHGTGLAIVFPSWIAEVKDKNPIIFKRWAKNVWGKDNTDEAIKAMKDKFLEWEVPISLIDIGLQDNTEDILKLIRTPLGQVKTLNEKEIRSILVRAK